MNILKSVLEYQKSVWYSEIEVSAKGMEKEKKEKEKEKKLFMAFRGKATFCCPKTFCCFKTFGTTQPPRCVLDVFLFVFLNDDSFLSGVDEAEG